MAKILIVSVPVKDQSLAAKWYQKMLGFRLLRDIRTPNSHRWVQLTPSSESATITLVSWFDSMPPGSLCGLVLGTAALDTDRARLRQRGVEISEIIAAPWGRYATFNDLDGNGWVLQESTD